MSCGSVFVIYVSCLSLLLHSLSVLCSLVITCWERACLSRVSCFLVCLSDFPFGVLGQVWYLMVVLIPDLYLISSLCPRTQHSASSVLTLCLLLQSISSVPNQAQQKLGPDLDPNCINTDGISERIF